MATLLRRRKLGKTSCEGIAEKSTQGIKVLRNDKGEVANNELVFRWGCTSNVDTRNIVNTAKAIHAVSDKAGFRRVLDEAELCPKTWFKQDDNIEYPCVVRPRVHAQGKHVYLCNNKNEVSDAVAKCGNGYYISEYIAKVAEYRVFVCQGRAVWVAKKTPADPTAIAWNVAKGGRFDNVRWDDWPLKAVKISIKALGLSGLDFGGVDVMVSADGDVTVLEINSAPSQTSPYRQSCVAKAFDYIVVNGKEIIPLTDQRGGYRKFIHPAVCDNAIAE